MKIAIYPGTFDPITNGHIDVIERASRVFDKVVVTIARNSAKTPFFSVEERKEMIKEVVKNLVNVEVDAFEGLLVEYALQKHATAVIRGLRAVSDFEYELQMALMNRKLADEIITVFLMPHEKYVYLDSSVVKEVAGFGGDVNNFVPPFVATKLTEKLKSLRSKG